MNKRKMTLIILIAIIIISGIKILNYENCKIEEISKNDFILYDSCYKVIVSNNFDLRNRLQYLQVSNEISNANIFRANKFFYQNSIIKGDTLSTLNYVLALWENNLLVNNYDDIILSNDSTVSFHISTYNWPSKVDHYLVFSSNSDLKCFGIKNQYKVLKTQKLLTNCTYYVLKWDID